MNMAVNNSFQKLMFVAIAEDKTVQLRKKVPTTAAQLNNGMH